MTVSRGKPEKPEDDIRKRLSIRVLRRENGDLLWEPPSGPGKPARVPLAIDADDWRGYEFWFSYDGTGDLTDLQIHRRGEAQPLTAKLLQRVPLGALDNMARECVRLFLEEFVQLNPDSELRELDAIADGNVALDKDIRLAKLCKRYLELNAKSGWRAILAREFGLHESSVQTTIGRARRRRFLTQVPRGQYGGRLTAKALRLLDPAGRGVVLDRSAREREQEPSEPPRFIRAEDMTPEQLEIAREMERNLKGKP